VNRSKLAALSAGAMFLVATVLAPVAALAAGSGTLSLSPSSVSLATGSTFYVDIETQAGVAMGGASASVDFDATKLQITSVTKPALGTGWNASGTTYVFPSASTISAANGSGHLAAVAAFFADGTSSLPANTNTVLARVTFFATAAGTSTISLPTTGADAGGILDGTTGAGYGTPATTTSSGATVTVTAGGAANNSATTNVTGTVDAGYVALTCPASVTVPLVRNVDNVADFTCAVGSNVTWTLSVVDQNTDPVSHGYMRDTAQNVKLTDPLFVRYNRQIDAGGNVVYDTSVNLASSPNAQTLAQGQNNVNAPLTFTQMARPIDVAGSYGMSVRFAVVSSF